MVWNHNLVLAFLKSIRTPIDDAIRHTASQQDLPCYDCVVTTCLVRRPLMVVILALRKPSCNYISLVFIYIYIYIYLVKFQLLLRLSWRATSTQSLLPSQPSAYVSPLRTVFRKIESGTVHEHSFLKP